MTNFNKIKDYYAKFDEQHRLDSNEGLLEYIISLDLLLKYLPKESKVLDLGGGAGKYSFELAKKGYHVTLADLSLNLLNQAKKEMETSLIPLDSIDEVNALDLHIYEDNSFDAVILFGPLYHLLFEEERIQCIKEVNRVLKKDGIVFASFIPYLAGSIAIVDRAFRDNSQVDCDNLSKVFKNGSFTNNANHGFQEGYYAKSEEIKNLFNDSGFNEILMRSIRGFGYEREEKIFNIKENNEELYYNIIKLINDTASLPSIIEMCGHAMYIGKKVNNI